MSVRVERLSVSAQHKSYSQLIYSFLICSSILYIVGEKWRKRFSSTSPINDHGGGKRRAGIGRMYAGNGPARKKKPGGSLLPARLDEASTRKPCVKARSPSACGLIPSIRSGSKYTNLLSALR